MKTKAERTDNINWAIAFTCWLTAAVSVAGSLFFSAVMELPPCVLCWYQRIFMFPLVPVLLAGLFPIGTHIVRFSLPLALAGWLTALYHTLLYSGIVPEGLEPCSRGVSCKETYLDLFGFLTIPLLSLLSFSVIAGLLIVLSRRLAK